MMPTDSLVAYLSTLKSHSRQEVWSAIISKSRAQSVLELGVWKGEFAEYLLRECPTIERYIMIDPWRHLDHWNKPANVDEATFEAIFAEAMSRTQFAADRRIVLRGTTLEKIDEIPDNSLDVIYVDADHTLRGISIDLVRAYPKVRPGGILGGDDYSPTIWQHPPTYEPTLVCPFAAYFAESQGATLVILPHNQFLISKPTGKPGSFRIIDTTGQYGERTLRLQFHRRAEIAVQSSKT